MGPSVRLAMRGCAIVMAAAAILIAVIYGMTWWSVLAVALLLACPVYVLWAVAQLDAPLPAPEDQPGKQAS